MRSGFYTVATAGCSFYLHLLIAYEVFVLLSATKRLESYTPPLRRAVLLRCLCVALPCALLGSLGTWKIFPHEARLMRGLICLPTGSGTIGRQSPLFLSIIFPLLILLPTLLSFALAFVSWRRKLFDFGIELIKSASNSEDLHMQAAHRQRKKQARAITLYFTRIFVTMLVWFPAMGGMLIPVHSPWPAVFTLPFIFLQVLVDAGMSLTEADVRSAVVDLLRIPSGLARRCISTRRVAVWQPRSTADPAMIAVGSHSGWALKGCGSTSDLLAEVDVEA